MIRVMIVDDQLILVEGLKMLLGLKDDLQVIATASNGEEAIVKCKAHQPDVILMDLKMPIMNGVEATRIIKQSYPDIKVIVLTTFKEDDYIEASIKYGASGYILKETPPKDIAKAIRVVFDGGALIDPSVATRVIEKYGEIIRAENKKDKESIIQLTEREKLICSLVGRGLNTEEIAGELFISKGTVKNHITNILSKLSLRDRIQLAIFAVKNKM